MQSFQELGIVLPEQLCAHDFNMDTTLYRGLKLLAFKSVQLIIDFILEGEDHPELFYQIMYDLPELLQQTSISVHKFFSLPRRKNNLQWETLCNIRKSL